jgi:hypothetical protein
LEQDHSPPLLAYPALRTLNGLLCCLYEFSFSHFCFPTLGCNVVTFFL